jgi:hypothetical protein
MHVRPFRAPPPIVSTSYGHASATERIDEIALVRHNDERFTQ